MVPGPGTILGSYQLVELLARGGMGEVYRARHRRLADREVAIKLMPAALAADPSFLQRFEREANNIAALNHPHILPLWDYGEQDQVPYIVMPLLTGGSLREYIRGRRLAPADVLLMLRPIADALDYAHSRGIVHRDIKPANVLLDDRGNLFVADFGIAKATEVGVEALTRTGVGIGTPEYMAPEQTQGQASPRSDIYALGIIVYEALTGRVPYSGKTPIDVAIKHATIPLPPVAWADGAVNPALAEVLRTALAKTPDDRFPSAGAFTAAFAEALQAPDPPAEFPTRRLGLDDRPTPVLMPPPSPPPAALPAPNPAHTAQQLPPSNTDAPDTPSSPPATRAGGRIAVMALLLGLVIGLGLAGGAYAVLSARGSLPTSRAEPTANVGVAAASGTPSPALPYRFPIDNDLLARKYDEARGLLPATVREEAKPHFLEIQCFNPHADADCSLAYSFYSVQQDKLYRYSFSVFNTRPVESGDQPATTAEDRTVYLRLPWQQNPDWARLLRDSYAKLPADFTARNFEVQLYSYAQSLNQGQSEWGVYYSSPDSDKNYTYTIVGTKVSGDN